MSSKENRNIISAYERMVEDGSAFKEVDMTMHNEPNISEITGARESSSFALGEVVNEDDEVIDKEDSHNNYNSFDSAMEQRINSLRNKMNGKNAIKKQGIIKSSQQEIASLKKRVEKLEEALMLVMETHERLIG